MTITADASPDMLSAEVDVAALLATAEVRGLRAQLIYEMHGIEASKRRHRDELNAWVATWIADHRIRLSDLDEFGAPIPSRVDEYALREWRIGIATFGVQITGDLTQRQRTIAKLRERIAELHRQTAEERPTTQRPDGVATMVAATAALATVGGNLAPVTPR